VPTAIDLEQLDRLLADGAQLVEALPADEYEEGHLPGAVSLPLKRLTPERVGALDPGRPVVVYCWDSL
jgi:phage shock protein E